MPGGVVLLTCTLGAGSSAALPLIRHGAAVGTFMLYSTEKNAFDEDTRKLLVEMATDIGFALELFAGETERKANEDEVRKLSNKARRALSSPTPRRASSTLTRPLSRTTVTRAMS